LLWPKDCARGPGLLFVVLHFDRFQVFGFKYLPAIQTFEIIDAIPAGDNLGTGVIASGRHIQRLDEVYFKRAGALVKPFYTPLPPGIPSHAPKAPKASLWILSWNGMGGRGIPMESVSEQSVNSGARTALASLAAIGSAIAAFWCGLPILPFVPAAGLAGKKLGTRGKEITGQIELIWLRPGLSRVRKPRRGC
jgi:hypothetical protein